MSLHNITSLPTCLSLLLVTLGGAVGGQSGMVIAFAIACAMNFFSYWYTDKIILKYVQSPRSTSSPRRNTKRLWLMNCPMDKTATR